MHNYKVIDIFSEESCESYMLVLEKQKERLRGMQQAENRANLILGRGQRNLRSSVYECKMTISKKSIG